MPRTDRDVPAISGAQRSTPAQRRRQLTFLAGLAAILSSTFLAIGQLTTGASETTLVVQQVVLDALMAEHALPVLPESVRETGVSPELRAEMIATAKSEIARLYSGSMVKARTETLVGGIELEGTPDGIFVWDGGVRDVDFQSVLIDKNLAVVKVQATAYLVVSQFATSERSYPENRANNTFELTLIDGRWYITDEDLEYLPGQAP